MPEADFSGLVKLGVTANGAAGIWSATFPRSLIDHLPTDERNVRLFLEDKRAILQFAKIGAKPYGKNALWVQIGPTNTNKVPRLPVHPLVVVNGEFHSAERRYTFDVLPFMTNVARDGYAKIDDNEQAKAPPVPKSGKRRGAETSQDKMVYTDDDVKALMQEVETMLARRPDIRVDIDIRRKVTIFKLTETVLS